MKKNQISKIKYQRLTNYQSSRNKGFTLIEILIVVIILAVLAAMVLPRFLGQTENAFIAEAQQQLGVRADRRAPAVDVARSHERGRYAEAR